MKASPPVSNQEQLEWERRWAKPAALSAFLAVALLIAGNVLRQAVALSDNPDDERELLIAIHDNAGAFIASSIVQALSFVALIGALWYLGNAVVARRPALPRVMLWLAVIGPVLLAIAKVVSDLARMDKADEFVASGPQTVDRAEDLLDGLGVAAAAIGSAGTLALAIALVFISVNAMRVGLLTRFMGVVGAIIGVLYVLPILAGPLLVQIFWLGALGVLFLGSWPGGRGPAWETGEAIEWPSGMARRGELDDPQGDVTQPPPAEAEPSAADGNGDPGGRSRSSRKRKRR